MFHHQEYANNIILKKDKSGCDGMGMCCEKKKMIG